MAGGSAFPSFTQPAIIITPATLPTNEAGGTQFHERSNETEREPLHPCEAPYLFPAANTVHMLNQMLDSQTRLVSAQAGGAVTVTGGCAVQRCSVRFVLNESRIVSDSRGDART